MAGNNVFAGEICAVIPLLMNGAPDIDTDGDPTSFEALSTGLRFQAAGGEILGVAVP